MADNIPVNPAIDAGAVDVATDEITDSEGKVTHYPVYKFAVGKDGEAILVSLDNAIPITAGSADLSRNSNDTEIFVGILNQLKILNLYMAEGFNFTFTEEDIEDDHDY